MWPVHHILNRLVLLKNLARAKKVSELACHRCQGSFLLAWWTRCLIVMFIGATASAVAEPTPTVSALMNQKVSLFSFGLFRLDEHVSRVTRDLPGFAGAEYDWDKNRIEISYTDFSRRTCKENDREGCERECKKVVDRIWETLCIGDSCNSYNVISRYFSHSGFTTKDVFNKKTDKELADSLIDITTVQVVIYGGAATSLVCTSGYDRKVSFRVE